ncbi:hypothetical protein TNCT_677881 [Trichonephila clavata]|uniref:Uncharacterized protein n=1 Tax=Trichonephila clavata TaxID=2740835 RepID=A0A8X6FDF7_TRICU|nr:hypothetical protein TNCT_677881 [Trichonephila clavata]
MADCGMILMDDWNEFRPRKNDVANFRLITWHDCLSKHLKNRRAGKHRTPYFKTDILNIPLARSFDFHPRLLCRNGDLPAMSVGLFILKL